MSRYRRYRLIDDAIEILAILRIHVNNLFEDNVIECVFKFCSLFIINNYIASFTKDVRVVLQYNYTRLNKVIVYS